MKWVKAAAVNPGDVIAVPKVGARKVESVTPVEGSELLLMKLEGDEMRRFHPQDPVCVSVEEEPERPALTDLVPKPLRTWVEIRDLSTGGPMSEPAYKVTASIDVRTNTTYWVYSTEPQQLQDGSRRSAKAVALRLAEQLEGQAKRIRECVKLSQFNLTDEKWSARQAGYQQSEFVGSPKSLDEAQMAGAKHVGQALSEHCGATSDDLAVFVQSYVDGWVAAQTYVAEDATAESADALKERVNQRWTESKLSSELLEEARRGGAASKKAADGTLGVMALAEEWRKENTTGGLTSAMNAQLQTEFVKGWKSA